MNLKDESIYYLKRILRKKIMQSKRENHPFAKYKCIFIHIPKTAGTSVAKSLLGKRIGHWSALQYRVAFGKKEFNNHFKFAFVRNPFTRLVSAYEFLQSGGYGPPDEQIISIIKYYKTWENFIGNYLTPTTAKAVGSFRPQHYFICDSDDHIIVDYLGRFENLETDYNDIREKMGVGEPLKKLNVTKNKKLAPYEYFSNKEILQKIISIYSKDFLLLGYSKEIPSIL
jgi:hypothetical protein